MLNSKNISLFLIAFAMLFLFASCEKENLAPQNALEKAPIVETRGGEDNAEEFEEEESDDEENEGETNTDDNDINDGDEDEDFDEETPLGTGTIGSINDGDEDDEFDLDDNITKDNPINDGDEDDEFDEEGALNPNLNSNF